MNDSYKDSWTYQTMLKNYKIPGIIVEAYEHGCSINFGQDQTNSDYMLASVSKSALTRFRPSVSTYTGHVFGYVPQFKLPDTLKLGCNQIPVDTLIGFNKVIRTLIMRGEFYNHEKDSFKNALYKGFIASSYVELLSKKKKIKIRN